LEQESEVDEEDEIIKESAPTEVGETFDSASFRELVMAQEAEEVVEEETSITTPPQVSEVEQESEVDEEDEIGTRI
jgi:hypothetical protein